jgi:Mg-chelatase subunit ChlD
MKQLTAIIFIVCLSYLQVISSEKQYSFIDTQTQDTNPTFDLSSYVTLNVELINHQISKAANVTALPLMVTLDVKDFLGEKRFPIDLVCVIDKSGSMAMENKINLVKDSLKKLLRFMKDDDRISLVFFDFNLELETPLTYTTAENKIILLQKIESLEAFGGTDIVRGLKSAFNILKQVNGIANTPSIFLLTDGLDSHNHNSEHVRQAIADVGLGKGFTIHTFGYGGDHNPTLLSEIAALQDGNFFFVDDLDNIDKTFVNCLGEVMSVLGQDVEVSLQLHDISQLPGLKVVEAFGLPGTWEWKTETNTYTTRLSQLIGGRQKNYMFELYWPASYVSDTNFDGELTIATVRCVINKPYSQNESEISTPLTLSKNLLITIEKIDKQRSVNENVIFHYARVKIAGAMKTATWLAENGKFDEAKKTLVSVKNQFLSTLELLDNSKEDVRILLAELENALKNIDVKEYHKTGQLYLKQSVRAQYEQRSYKQEGTKGFIKPIHRAHVMIEQLMEDE